MLCAVAQRLYSRGEPACPPLIGCRVFLSKIGMKGSHGAKGRHMGLPLRCTGRLFTAENTALEYNACSEILSQRLAVNQKGST